MTPTDVDTVLLELGFGQRTFGRSAAWLAIQRFVHSTRAQAFTEAAGMARVIGTLQSDPRSGHVAEYVAAALDKMAEEARNAE